MTDKKYKGWYDGQCKLCGHDVEEVSCQTVPISEFEEKDRKLYHESDYANRCTNPNCENHKWHPVADDEFLDYYVHEGMED